MLAFATGLTLFIITTSNCFCEEAREGGLADAAGTCEEIGMPRLSFGDARLEDADSRILTDDLGEKLWAIFAREGHRGRS